MNINGGLTLYTRMTTILVKKRIQSFYRIPKSKLCSYTRLELYLIGVILLLILEATWCVISHV